MIHFTDIDRNIVIHIRKVVDIKYIFSKGCVNINQYLRVIDYDFSKLLSQMRIKIVKIN